MSLKLRFFDLDPAVVEALSVAFADVPDATAERADARAVLRDAGAGDAVVSPANSFGIMDGGIDAAYIRLFGLELQEAVQKAIRDEWAGEQPVGTCLAVPIPTPAGGTSPFLLHAPTMRSPQSIRGTDAVYRAFRAVLLTALRGVEPWRLAVEEADRGQPGRRASPIRRILSPG